MWAMWLPSNTDLFKRIELSDTQDKSGTALAEAFLAKSLASSQPEKIIKSFTSGSVTVTSSYGNMFIGRVTINDSQLFCLLDKSCETNLTNRRCRIYNSIEIKRKQIRLLPRYHTAANITLEFQDIPEAVIKKYKARPGKDWASRNLKGPGKTIYTDNSINKSLPLLDNHTKVESDTCGLNTQTA